tara:strand:- start:53 stop:1111 length:1059 start_codon:yes stop_codon:yes gene_type:complete
MAFSTINKVSSHQKNLLWTGNGSNNRNITGVGFNPDFVWWKARSNTNNHAIANTVTGTSGTNYILGVNSTGSFTNWSDIFKSFYNDGYTVGTDSAINQNGQAYCGWNFLGGGAASANSNGTITSQVSANTTGGISIASWSGTGSNASVGHGLGGVDCMIIKNTNSTRDWYFWNKSMAYNDRLELNNTEAITAGTDNMTALPDATKINMATSTQNNGSGQNYIGFFFQEIRGMSKFGSYTGNGSGNGTFVNCGFKPTLVILKRSNSAGDDWLMYDSTRGGPGAQYDAMDANNNKYFLSPNRDIVEGNESFLLTSNGFKCRVTNDFQNGSGSTYRYMAFGQPIISNSGTPATAR